MTALKCPHIVFVAQQTGNRSNGGLESATQIFEALHDAFQWTFVTNHRSAFVRRWSDRGARVVIVSAETNHGGLRRAWASARLALRLMVIARFSRPDVFHANDSRSMTALLALPRVLRSRLLFTVRGTQMPDKMYGRHWREAAERCQRIVVLSHEMAAALAPRLGADPARFEVIESIVDLQRFHPREDGRQAGVVAIGSIGVFALNKGQLGLIESAAPLLRADPGRCRLRFYGDFDPVAEAYSRRCVQAVERLGLQDAVSFNGHVDDMAAAYRSMDILALPSEREGLSRAMIEAMASGVPVVSFAVCSAREMLEETGAGIVVPEGDFSAMARAISDLANDSARRAAMGAAGRAVAEQRFGAARARRAWLDLYSEVAEARREQGRAPGRKLARTNARDAERPSL